MKSQFRAVNRFISKIKSTSSIDGISNSGTFQIQDIAIGGFSLPQGAFTYFVTADFAQTGKEEIFRIVNTAGDVLTYDKRISVGGYVKPTHAAGASIRVNDVADILNEMSDNIDNFGDINRIDGTQTVKVWGGVFNNGGTVYNVSSQTLIVTFGQLVDNTTNYIHFDIATRLFIVTASSTLAAAVCMASVVVAGGTIGTITDLRPGFAMTYGELTTKLDKNGGLGYGYSPNKIFTTDVSGNMTTVDISTIIPSGSIIDTSFIAGETLLPREAVFVENMGIQNNPMSWYTAPAAVASNNVSAPLYGTNAVNNYMGMRFTVSSNQYFTGGTIHSGCEANIWRLLDGGNTLIANGSISGTSITYGSEVLLTTGVQYKLEVSHNSINWNYTRANNVIPFGSTNVTYQSSTSNIIDFDTTASINIASILSRSTVLIFTPTAKKIGDIANNTRKTIAVWGAGISGNSVNLQIVKTGTPFNLGIRIETDNAGNPSGVLADANAMLSLASTSIPNPPAQALGSIQISPTLFTFPGSFTLTKNTKYHLVFFQGTYGSETVNPSNYYMISWDSLTSCQINKTWNGSTYTNQTGIKTYLDSTLFNPYLLRKSCGSTAFQAQCDGINVSSVSEGQIASLTKFGAHTTFTGLAERTKFYLSNTPGAISSSPGTVSVGVGTSGISTTLNVGMYKVT